MEIIQTGFPQGRPGIKTDLSLSHTHAQFHSAVRSAQIPVLVIFLKPE